MHQTGVAAFGEELRRAREARGLAVESVCEATKVPLRHIRALEAGSYDELPGGVFRRGFVRSYVSLLGLEETDWMKRFEESCKASGLRDASGAEWAAFAENVKSNRAQSYRRAGLRGGLVVLLLATLAIAGWCGWRLKTHRHVLPVRFARLMPILHPVKAASQ
jgi:cytoskeletal protein RodZ